jgi:hypothetical protein
VSCVIKNTTGFSCLSTYVKDAFDQFVKIAPTKKVISLLQHKIKNHSIECVMLAGLILQKSKQLLASMILSIINFLCWPKIGLISPKIKIAKPKIHNLIRFHKKLKIK